MQFSAESTISGLLLKYLSSQIMAFSCDADAIFIPKSPEELRYYQKVCIEQGMLNAYAISLPSRGLAYLIEKTCDSSAVAKLSCEIIGDLIQQSLRVSMDVMKSITPLNMQYKIAAVKSEIISGQRQMPDLFFKEYGIPKNETKGFLESMTHNLTYLGMWGGGKVLGTFSAALKKRASDFSSFKTTLPLRFPSTYLTLKDEILATTNQLQTTVPVIPKNWKEWVQRHVPSPSPISDIKYLGGWGIEVTSLKIGEAPYIIKEFSFESNSFFLELEGMKHWNALKLQHSVAPSPIAVGCIPEQSFSILMPFVPGDNSQTVASLLGKMGSLKKNDPLRMTYFKQTLDSLSKVGKALGEVHAKTMREFTLSDVQLLQKHISISSEYIHTITEKLPFKLPQFESKNVLQAITENPGPATLLHGDFHLKNILLNPLEKPGIIDFEFLPGSLNRLKQSIGVPLRDTYTFLSDLEAKSIMHNFSMQEIQLLKYFFTRGYRSEFSHRPPQPLNALYRLRHDVTTLDKIAKEFPRTDARWPLLNQIVERARKDGTSLSEIKHSHKSKKKNFFYPHVNRTSLTSPSFLPQLIKISGPLAGGTSVQSILFKTNEQFFNTLSKKFLPQQFTTLATAKKTKELTKPTVSEEKVAEKALQNLSMSQVTFSSQSPKDFGITVVQPISDHLGLNSSYRLNPFKPKESFFSFQTSFIHDQNVVSAGAVINPLHPKKLQVPIAYTLKEGGLIGGQINPRHPLKSNINVASNFKAFDIPFEVKGTIILSKPLESRFSGKVPLTQWLYVGCDLKLKRPENLKLSLGISLGSFSHLGTKMGFPLPSEIKLMSLSRKSVEKQARRVGHIAKRLFKGLFGKNKKLKPITYVHQYPLNGSLIRELESSLQCFHLNLIQIQHAFANQPPLFFLEKTITLLENQKKALSEGVVKLREEILTVTDENLKEINTQFGMTISTLEENNAQGTQEYNIYSKIVSENHSIGETLFEKIDLFIENKVHLETSIQQELQLQRENNNALDRLIEMLSARIPLPSANNLIT